jgi:hypothetical protein
MVKTMLNYEIKTNEQYKSKEIYFNEKPTKEIIATMKSKKMRWNPKKTCWYGFINEEDIKEIFNDNALVIPETSFVDGYGLYDGWEGGKNHTWRNDKELKQLLLNDFKKVGLKATIRFNKAGYLTSLTVTMTIKKEDIKSFEEWDSESYHIVASSWNNYRDENGELQTIYGEKFYSLDIEEQRILFDNIKRTDYEQKVKRLMNDSCFDFSEIDILNEKANRNFKLLKDIVASYNKDCSNSQIDYFDRDIYDHYRFKVV